MSKQLRLIEPRASWRMDERTRQIGREGVAKAREALRERLNTDPHGSKAA